MYALISALVGAGLATVTVVGGVSTYKQVDDNQQVAKELQSGQVTYADE